MMQEHAATAHSDSTSAKDQMLTKLNDGPKLKTKNSKASKLSRALAVALLLASNVESVMCTAATNF
jgi:hypothetical protein